MDIKYILILLLVSSFSFLQIDCKDDPPVVPPPPHPYKQSIFLSVADSGLTEVYLKLSMTDTLPPRGFAILRNNVQILSGSLFGKETTLVDTTAQRNTNYFYQAFRLENAARKDSSSIVTTKTMDTTSLEFVWTEFTFGDISSSVFYGTLILNDTTIYALGNIIVGDSVFAIAKGNGTNWQLIKLFYRTDTGDTLNLSTVRDLYLKNNNAINLFSGSIFEWNGSSSMAPLIYSRFSLPNVDGTIDKIFGTNSNNIYAVGRGGSIVYYNGTSWQAQSSGTTVDLTDIWGTPDGQEIKRNVGYMNSTQLLEWIGDTVNLGARLCSAAGRGQIIVSEYAATYVMNDDSILLTKLEPIKVKGKEAFIEIYEARARGK